jgi:GNAT superfamily N-acetyltransferase
VIAYTEVSDDAAIVTVERLAREIWTDHFEPIIGVPQVEYMLKEFQSVAAIRRYLTEGYKYYLVYSDALPVGYMGILSRSDSGELFLSKFYLLQEYRGRGMGRQMMEFIKAFARENGLKKISLNTNKRNLDTIRFYEKAGFVKRCSDVIDIGCGFVADDWLMEMAV